MDPLFGSEYLLIADSVEQVPNAMPRADVPDAGDAVVRAPGAAAAWSMDGASESTTNGMYSTPPGRASDSNSYSTPLERVHKRARETGARGDAAAAAQRAVSESVVPDAVDEVPDSVDDDVPDAVEDVPDAVEDDVPDAVEEVPDVDEVVDCPRCRTFHAGGVFGEACRQARRNARRCARCGLLHEDYDLVTQVLDGMENFDCKFYIPVVEELQLEGNTIILPEQVVQKLDEMNQARKSAKANKEGEASKDEASKH